MARVDPDFDAPVVRDEDDDDEARERFWDDYEDALYEAVLADEDLNPPPLHHRAALIEAAHAVKPTRRERLRKNRWARTA